MTINDPCLEYIVSGEEEEGDDYDEDDVWVLAACRDLWRYSGR